MKNVYSNVQHWNNEEGFITIDAWKTDDPNEEGKVVAVINEKTAEVFYITPESRFDDLVKEEINAVCAELSDKTSAKSIMHNWSVAARAFRENAEKFMLDFMKKHNVTTILFDRWAETKNGGCYPAASYDGGNHPEYASNLCDCAVSISIKGSSLTIELESGEDDEYEISRLSDNELAALFDAFVDFEEDSSLMEPMNYDEED